MEEKIIQPIAIPGIHNRFFKLFENTAKSFNNPKILDAGAGHGALSKTIFEAGYNVEACDLFPEIFYFDKVPFKKADITSSLPYEDNTFDIIIAVEVMEHIHDHEQFFKECFRILKKGGILLLSTPNILSMKSRVRFLFTGFYYSFEPLNHQLNNGLQHVASLTVDQYRNIAIRTQFADMEVFIDKKQGTSKAYLFLLPFMWLYCKMKKVDFCAHNKHNYLTGRILFLKLLKK